MAHVHFRHFTRGIVEYECGQFVPALKLMRASPHGVPIGKSVRPHLGAVERDALSLSARLLANHIGARTRALERRRSGLLHELVSSKNQGDPVVVGSIGAARDADVVLMKGRGGSQWVANDTLGATLP
eukprot:3660745-Prymnesium_polylepis.1